MASPSFAGQSVHTLHHLCRHVNYLPFCTEEWLVIEQARVHTAAEQAHLARRDHPLLEPLDLVEARERSLKTAGIGVACVPSTKILVEEGLELAQRHCPCIRVHLDDRIDERKASLNERQRSALYGRRGGAELQKLLYRKIRDVDLVFVKVELWLWWHRTWSRCVQDALGNVDKDQILDIG